jgi:tetratricopeptide (TPR) repeat protein
MDEMGARDEIVRADEAIEASEPVIEPGSEAPIGPRRGINTRWLVQFGIGAVVAGALVFGIGKRAELSSAMTLSRARQEMQSGRSFQAARALEGVIKQDPNDRELQVALLEAHYRAGEPERARELANKVVLTPDEEKRIEPLVRKLESASELLLKGRDFLLEHQFTQALPLLQKAAKEVPDSPLPHAMLAQASGGLYFGRQKPEDLQTCLAAERRLAEIDPKTAEEVKKRLGPIEVIPQVLKHTSAADAALKEGKTEAAVPELEAADKLYPNSAMVHALRAVVHAQRFEKTGSAEEKRLALEEYRTAVQLNPARSTLRPRLGKLAAEATAGD